MTAGEHQALIRQTRGDLLTSPLVSSCSRITTQMNLSVVTLMGPVPPPTARLLQRGSAKHLLGLKIGNSGRKSTTCRTARQMDMHRVRLSPYLNLHAWWHSPHACAGIHMCLSRKTVRHGCQKWGAIQPAPI
jgi:hypothetical protein